MRVQVYVVKHEDLQSSLQQYKRDGGYILALSPKKIVRGVVSEYTVAVRY